MSADKLMITCRLIYLSTLYFGDGAPDQGYHALHEDEEGKRETELTGGCMQVRFYLGDGG